MLSVTLYVPSIGTKGEEAKVVQLTTAEGVFPLGVCAGKPVAMDIITAAILKYKEDVEDHLLDAVHKDLSEENVTAHHHESIFEVIIKGAKALIKREPAAMAVSGRSLRPYVHSRSKLMGGRQVSGSREMIEEVRQAVRENLDKLRIDFFDT